MNELVVIEAKYQNAIMSYRQFFMVLRKAKSRQRLEFWFIERRGDFTGFQIPDFDLVAPLLCQRDFPIVRE